MAYVENPIVAGKDFKSVMGDVNGNFEDIKKMLEYIRLKPWLTDQKPWDLNENVKVINLNSGKCSCIPDPQSSDETTYTINMINSGRIRLSYGRLRKHSSVYDGLLTISVNDTIVAEHTDFPVASSNNHNGNYNDIILDVNKGDKIKFYMKCRNANTQYYYGIQVEDICIYANYDTPYKYFYLT